MSEPAKPGILDRLRARFGWFDHVVRAYQRFDERNGGFFAAGLTYYTIFALFPLLMVGFAVVGFVLSRRPQLLSTIDDHIRSAVSGALGQQLVDLMNSAIDARASVGIIGLATAAWAGLGWMSHLRAALTEMWWDQRIESPGFVRNKLSDLVAMVGTFVVILATLALTALGHAAPMAAVLRWLGIPEFSVFDGVFSVVSILVSLLVSWLLFTWMIARLPRQKVSLVNSMRAGLMAAIGFELFKQVASIYLRVVSAQPGGRHVRAGAGLDGVRLRHRVSGPVRHRVGGDGVRRIRAPSPSTRPPPAIIARGCSWTRGSATRQTLTAMAVGAVGALAFSRLTRWLPLVVCPPTRHAP